MMWRLISSNWCSVLVNGQSYGLFQSTTGLKQGDPLSPTLFIITAEVLSKGLNSLHMDKDFKGYSLPKWSPEVNHLSYADDIILCCSGDMMTIIKMMKNLRSYEEEFRQLINKFKSFFYLHDKFPLIFSIRLRKLIGIRQDEFSFTYLGCPIYYERKKGGHFEEIVRKISRKI